MKKTGITLLSFDAQETWPLQIDYVDLDSHVKRSVYVRQSDIPTSIIETLEAACLEIIAHAETL